MYKIFFLVFKYLAFFDSNVVTMLLYLQYFVPPNIPVPKPAPKGNYGVFTLRPIQSLFNSTSPIHLTSRQEKSTKSFEELGQCGGYVLYETVVPANVKDGALLDICSMHDRANVYLNHVSQMLANLLLFFFFVRRKTKLKYF